MIFFYLPVHLIIGFGCEKCRHRPSPLPAGEGGGWPRTKKWNMQWAKSGCECSNKGKRIGSVFIPWGKPRKASESETWPRLGGC